MKVWVLLLFALLYYSTLLAQNHNSITVRSGSTISQTLSLTDLYHFAQFQQGRIFYKDGTTSSGRLNYHRFFSEMQFLSSGGDTLAVANEPTIRLLVMGTDSFYYHEGFVKLLSSTPDLKLAERRWLKVADRQKMGGYGQASSTSAITSYKSYQIERQIIDLTVREDLILTREVQYFLGDRYGRFLPANKKNVLSLYAKQEGAVKGYLKEHPVDFRSRADVDRLFLFLAQL